MLHFNYSTIINAPVEILWNFHERDDILDLLTPPWQPIQVIRRQGGLGIGAVSEFRIFVGLIPLQWIAVHIEYEQYRLFSDQQKEGPFDYWVHRHQFIPEDQKTRLTDSIEFALPGGSLVEDMFGWLVTLQLEQMFRYRHEVTQRECSKLVN